MSGSISSYLTTAIVLAGGPALSVTSDVPVSQPELREFVLDVARRTSASDSATGSFESRYDFVHTKTTEESNLKGELRKREVERTHHHPGSAHGNPEGRAERNTPENAGDDEEVSRDDFHIDAKLLSRFAFSPVGEESVKGRPQRILEFKPSSPRLPAHNFKDRYVNQTAGTLWVDAEALVLTRLKVRLLRPVNVWGGLIGVVSEFDFDLERECTAEGAWYTRRVQWHVKGRKLFVTKIVDFHEERTNVRHVR
jgi:hypothetical protein